MADGSPSKRSGSTEGSRISALESQVNELRALLEAERAKHREEQRSAATKLRLLESASKNATDGSTTVVVKKTSTTTPRSAGPATPRDMVISNTPRTSDHLFVATKSSSNGRVVTTTTTTTTTALRTRTRVGGAATSTAARKASSAVETAGGAESASAASTDGAATAKTELKGNDKHGTALQHAWDKFCVMARPEFTPAELALVSAETIDRLLNFYNIRNPIERAQIEAQWALLQEGKESVGANATPRVVQSPRRKPIHYATHEKAFSLQPDALKPKLSRKQLLNPEQPKPSNPNTSTSASKLIRSNSTNPIKPREVAPSNPNDTQSRPTTPRLCFRRCNSAGPSDRETPRGMAHVAGPVANEHRDRGIKSEGSTREGGDWARPTGVRTGIEPSFGDDHRRGVRTTYEKDSSPTRVPRPTKIVSTPPHILRTHLGTHTLGTQGQRPGAPMLSPRQAWTPFAVDC